MALSESETNTGSAANPFAAVTAAHHPSCGYTLALLGGLAVGLLVLIIGGAILWEAIGLHAIYTGSLDPDESLLRQLTRRQQFSLITGGLLVIAASYLLGRRIHANIEGQFERIYAFRAKRRRLRQQVDELQQQVWEKRKQKPSSKTFDS